MKVNNDAPLYNAAIKQIALLKCDAVRLIIARKEVPYKYLAKINDLLNKCLDYYEPTGEKNESVSN